MQIEKQNTKLKGGGAPRENKEKENNNKSRPKGVLGTSKHKLNTSTISALSKSREEIQEKRNNPNGKSKF